MAHIEQQNRPRFTLEEAKKSKDSWNGMISHVIKNPEGDFSVMGHIVCEWCDYCTEQEDDGILIHEFREDPYAIFCAADQDWSTPDNAAISGFPIDAEFIARKALTDINSEQTITDEAIHQYEAESGIYITLSPHGYEIDLVNHKMMLDLYMKHRDLFSASECRDYGDDINTVEITKHIMNLVRNAEQQTKLIDDIWEIVEPLIGVGLDDIDTRDMKIEVRDSLIKKFGYEQIK